MRHATSILLLLSLAFGYALGLAYVVGQLATIDWPWSSLSGRSALEAGLLRGLSHAIAVIGVATVIGLLLVLRFRSNAAPKLALIVALPATLSVLLAMRPGLDLRTLLMLKDLLLIAGAPAAVMVLMARRFGPPAQPSGGAVSG